MSRSFSAFVIAGTHSGVGKTTVTLGLLAALRCRKLKVQPFKVGPDFIDPGLHREVAGTVSHNLDGWMLSRNYNFKTFRKNSHGRDVAVVEGVMGLFDGFEGKSDHGSTAEMAKWLDLPVVLVVDASAMARSAAAMILGFLRFDPKLKVIGVIFNRIAGTGHLHYLEDAMASLSKVECLGGLPYDDRIKLPERHLGLVTAEEGLIDQKLSRLLADWIENHVDLDCLLAKSRAASSIPKINDGNRPSASGGAVTIGVARDKAFCFYYPDNLHLLQAAGARLVPFSPMCDRTLPSGVRGLYLGGGYPELYARDLARNRSMREAVRGFIESGGVVYAECGGFMYLSQGLTDSRARSFPMVGIYPVRTRMLSRFKAFGYREIAIKRGSFFPSGCRARGHEFHYSELEGNFSPTRKIKKVYVLSAKEEKREEGFQYKNCLASYVHLHFGSNPKLATGLVEAAGKVSCQPAGKLLKDRRTRSI